MVFKAINVYVVSREHLGAADGAELKERAWGFCFSFLIPGIWVPSPIPMHLGKLPHTNKQFSDISRESEDSARF